MSKSSQIVDDVLQLAGGVAGIASDIKGQIENDVRARVEEIAARMDLVPREDLERVEAILDTMEQRIKALEEQLNGNKEE